MTADPAEAGPSGPGGEAPRLGPWRLLHATRLRVSRFSRVSRILFWIEGAICCACLVGLIVVPGYQILARAVPALPLPLWTYDVSTVFLVWLAFIGAAMAERARTPPVVTIITDKLPFMAQGVLSVVGAAVSIAIFAVIAFDAAQHIPEQWAFGVGDLSIPLGLYNVALPIGAALVAVHLFARLRDAARLLTRSGQEQAVKDRAAKRDLDAL